MSISIDLEERTTDEGVSAEYFLIVQEKNQKRSIPLGKANKTCTFMDGFKSPGHEARRNLATALSMEYQPPTPIMLEYFSSKTINDVLIAGEKANISPSKEVEILRALVKEISEIDPGLIRGTPEKVTQVGNKPADSVCEKIRKAYNHFFPYNQHKQNL